MPSLSSAMFRTAQRGGSFLDRVINGSPLGDPRFRGERYSTYADLLSNGPLIRSYLMGGWALLSFKAVQEGLLDPRFSSDVVRNPAINRMYRFAAGGTSALLDNPMLVSKDPPEHSRLRRLARQAFLHRYVRSLEPKIREITDQCLASAKGKRRFDLIDTLARPLPSIVIANILGIEGSDRELLLRQSESFARNSAVIDIDSIREADRAFHTLLDLMEMVVAKKRTQPGDEFISNLFDAEADGDRLTLREVTSMCTLLVFAGYETTMRLIGNAVYLLLQHPEQMRRLREDLALLPNAIEEALRFEPPAQLVTRTAVEEAELFGRRIRKGQFLILVIASANRDRAANQNPDRFDIFRENIQHVSFGHGVHLCLGAELARLESRIALEMLLDRFPRLELAGETRWEDSYWVRGLERLVLDTLES